MILSRRSFLKVAGLSAVAVAGASMFTGCNANNFFTTPVVYVAGDKDKVTTDAVATLNGNKAATSVLGHSDLHNTDMDKEKEYFNSLINGLKVTGVKVTGVEVKEVKMVWNEDKKYWNLVVTIIKETKKTEKK